jgi:hypothetical protein
MYNDLLASSSADHGLGKAATRKLIKRSTPFTHKRTAKNASKGVSDAILSFMVVEQSLGAQLTDLVV